MSVGEREKGHEWKFLFKFDGLIFSKCECGEPKGTMWTDKKQHAAHLTSLEAQPRTYKCVKCCDTGTFAGLPCQLCSHPSAGRSDAMEPPLVCPTCHGEGEGCSDEYHGAVEQNHELYASLGKILSFGKSDAEIIAEITDLFNARLAESRAAMREVATELADATDDLLNTMLNSRTWAQRERVAKAIAAIRSLPADSSALDAKDARVRLEAYEVILKNFNSGASLDVCKTQLRYDIADLRRSAETKGGSGK